MHEHYQKVAEDRAATAASERMEPMEATPERINLWRQATVTRTLPVYLFPYLGTYSPPGWRRVSLRQVDHTKGVHMGENNGFGVYVVSSPENAPRLGCLDPFEFAIRAERGWGYAIVGENTGCVLIGAFKRREG